MLAISILFTDRHLVAFYKIIFFTLKHINSILGEFRPIASRYWLRKDFWNDYCQWWVIPRGYLFDPLKKPQANFYQVNKSCLWYPWLVYFAWLIFLLIYLYCSNQHKFWFARKSSWWSTLFQSASKQFCHDFYTLIQSCPLLTS